MSITVVKPWWFRVAVVVLVFTLLLLALNVWAALQVRAHQSRVTGITLTLTRIAQLASDVTEGAQPATAFSGDQLAQLIATGDVQAGDINATKANVMLERFAFNSSELLSQWQVVRGSASVLNKEAVAIDDPALVAANTMALTSVQSSFDALFDSIINETLSKSLLELASAIRGDLISLSYLVASGAPPATVQSLLANVQDHTQQLRLIAKPQQGTGLLGYGASGRLDDFIAKLSAFELAEVSTSTSGAVSTQSALSRVTNTALSQATGYLRLVDLELHKKRRDLLIALGLCCLSILLLTALAWSQRRRGQISSDHQVQEVLAADLNRIANGTLNQPSSLASVAGGNQTLADMVDHTAAMIGRLVGVSRDVAHRTTDLSSAQQQLAESMFDLSSVREVERSRQLAELRQLVAALVATPGAGQLQKPVQTANAVTESVNAAASALAGISAQLEIGAGRIDRAIAVSKELNTAVVNIESTSQQANLQALNESIKHTGLYDSDHESEEFVQKTQMISRRLQMESSGALSQSRDIQTDLEACAQSLRECVAAIEQSAEHSLNATQSLKGLASSDQAAEPLAAQEAVEAINAAIDTLATPVDSLAEQESLLSIKGHALELQLVAAKLDESLLRFALAEKETDE